MDELLLLNEVEFVVAEIDFALNNIDEWVKPQYRKVPMLMVPASTYIMNEPLGVVLLISPWNYPISLVLKPLVGAIAAGNAAVMKPSEVSHDTACNLQTLLPKYLDPAMYAVISGGVEETTELLKYQFDHIIYTGNGTIAKHIARAAAEHLTPVTLELGGKSPVILDDSIDLSVAVPRIIWGKFSNCGQTCVAPDYILAKRNVYDAFLTACVKQINQFYGKDTKNSKDYGKIINEKHTRRILTLLEGQDIYFGGEHDEKAHFVAPTIVANPPLASKLMQDEIFGPVLPVIPYDDLDEAIAIIKQRSKPLALYVFTTHEAVREKVLRKTSSGGGGINETVNHVICRDLPFGGVGDSGIGAYNGHHSFLLFSNQRGILQRSAMKGADPPFRFPPFTSFGLNIVMIVSKLNQPRLPSLLSIVTVLVLLFVAIYF